MNPLAGLLRAGSHNGVESLSEGDVRLQLYGEHSNGQRSSVTVSAAPSANGRRRDARGRFLPEPVTKTPG